MTTLRVALQGRDALGDSNPNHFAVYGDADPQWVLIKEALRGGGMTNASGTMIKVDHNLGLVPLYISFDEVVVGSYRTNNVYNILGAGWKISVNTSVLKFSGWPSRRFRYYICYDYMNVN
jgi:hypothetical protein